MKAQIHHTPTSPVYLRWWRMVQLSAESLARLKTLRRPKRSVMSGLLARGPGYRANKRDIEEAAKANMVMLADMFRERERPVIRHRQ